MYIKLYKGPNFKCLPIVLVNEHFFFFKVNGYNDDRM